MNVVDGCEPHILFIFAHNCAVIPNYEDANLCCDNLGK